jgi:MFS transporter, putative metabolite:H+ symporter
MSVEELARPGAVPPTAPPQQTTSLPVGAAFKQMALSSIHIKIGLVLFVTFAIESWEMLTLSYVAGDLGHDLHLGAGQVGLVISALFLGMIPGSLLWGPLADRIGRRATCLWSLVGYGVLTLLGSVAPNYQWLLATRFLAGLAFAGIFTITFLYFEELLPVRSRGRATVYLAAGWPIGTLAALGVVALFGGSGWRVVVSVSAAAALWALAIRRWVPESPYWLAQQGRSNEAHDVLARLGARDLDRSVQLTVPDVRAGSIVAMFRGRLARVTILQLAVNFMFSWGYWGLQTWLPTLLQDRGLTASSSLSFIAVSAIFMIPGYLSASFLTGRFGRKKVFVVYVLAAAAGGFYFATATSLTGLYAGIFGLSFFSLGAWGIWDTWVGELYPSPVRSVGYSIGVFGQRVANTIAPTLIGLLLAYATGFSATVLFINAFLVATAILAAVLPETEGRELS